MDPREIEAKANEFRSKYKLLKTEIAKAIVGHDEVVDGVLTAMFAGGNCLLEGVPGLGKTLLVHTLAAAIGSRFARIQCTPDLMPADVLGTRILVDDEAGGRRMTFEPGPVFTEVLLADEVNRATPRTQSALLEAMQEGSVTLGGVARPLPDLFFVLATQNPIDMEGTYPLPEAQLDRFLFKLQVGYPDRDHERSMVKLHGHRTAMPTLEELGVTAVADLPTIEACRAVVREVRLSDEIVDYVVDLVRATRGRPTVACGASPRAANMLASASRALAVLRGRDFVTPDDVKALAVPTLRHRLVLAPGAEIEGLTAEGEVRRVLEEVAAPR